MGGVWERMIGVCRRILHLILLETKVSLTHVLLTTFLVEVCAIVIARLLVPVSPDPNVPEISTPAVQLIMKTTPLPAPLGDFGHPPDIFGSQWRRLQHFTNTFWSRCRK